MTAVFGRLIVFEITYCSSVFSFSFSNSLMALLIRKRTSRLEVGPRTEKSNLFYDSKIIPALD